MSHLNLVIYLKPNNTLKYSTTKNNLEVGETNGYGHLVLGKYVLYNNCYVTDKTFVYLFNKDLQKDNIKQQKIDKLYKILEEIRNAI